MQPDITPLLEACFVLDQLVTARLPCLRCRVFRPIGLKHLAPFSSHAFMLFRRDWQCGGGASNPSQAQAGRQEGEEGQKGQEGKEGEKEEEESEGEKGREQLQ